MAPLLALSLLAAPHGGAAAAPREVGAKTTVTTSARAFVRILPAARIVMDHRAKDAEHPFVNARITVEDGSRRDAKLVEFQ